MNEPRVFNVDDGLKFERDDATGDVLIHVEGMTVRMDANSWVSAVAEMTCHGSQANHAAFHYMHTGIGEAV